MSSAWLSGGGGGGSMRVFFAGRPFTALPLLTGFGAGALLSAAHKSILHQVLCSKGNQDK